MAWSCSVSNSPTGCGHRVLTIVRDDASTRQIHLHESDVAGAFTVDDEVVFVTLAAKRLAAQGVTLASLAGRVLIGSEATNVRSYDFFGPGAAITKTNIGTSYVNIPPGTNGERILVDLTGATEFRIVVSANLIGTGPFGLRAVRDGDSAVLYENASIALTGERELDSNWQPIPIAAGNLEVLRIQAKSTTASDDPVFRRATILIR